MKHISGWVIWLPFFPRSTAARLSGLASPTSMVNDVLPPVPEPRTQNRRRVVVVGFGMVGLAFIEKLLNYDSKENGGNSYAVTIIGDESYVAYNRVGLTQYFSHRKLENLYLNPQGWYSSHEPGRLIYHTDTCVERIDSEQRKIHTNK